VPSETISSRLQGPVRGLLQAATVAQWRARNFRRTFRQHINSDPRPDFSIAISELSREGILTPSLQQILHSSPPSDIAALAQSLFERARRERTEGDLSGRDKKLKGFRVLLLGDEVELDNPFLLLALHPRMLEIANLYMRMRVYLRALELWWDRPTPDSPSDTQLWHRDSDDVMNLKAFIYFNEVSLEEGPFCFIPRSQVLGDRALLAAKPTIDGRVTDEVMSTLVSPREWSICTGGPGSVIFCDTTGYHKGLKPSKNHRLMLTIQYTSGVPRYPRAFSIKGNTRAHNFSAAQLDALNLDVS
jgi:hypothetical protein